MRSIGFMDHVPQFGQTVRFPGGLICVSEVARTTKLIQPATGGRLAFKIVFMFMYLIYIKFQPLAACELIDFYLFSPILLQPFLDHRVSQSQMWMKFSQFHMQ